MRTLKFRAWDKNNKKFFNVSQIVFEGFGKKEGVQIDDEGLRWLDYNDVILMQFTGLMDKNGKKIYEGDILGELFGGELLEFATWEIIFENACFGYRATKINLENYPSEDPCLKPFYNSEDQELVNTERFEVIGNIYENRELMETNP